MEALHDFVKGCSMSEHDDIKRVGTLVQRVLDWVAAESKAASRSLKISVGRDEDGNVVIVDANFRVAGIGEGVLPALQDWLMKIDDMYNRALADEEDTVGFKEALVSWVEEFPHD
jgi:hypothetical protein